MPPKRPVGGSGNAGAAKAPEHGVEMETEVAVTADELSLHPDVVDSVELPQPEAELLGNVVISKKFLRTRRNMVMHSNERGECRPRTLVDR